MQPSAYGYRSDPRVPAFPDEHPIKSGPRPALPPKKPCKTLFSKHYALRRAVSHSFAPGSDEKNWRSWSFLSPDFPGRLLDYDQRSLAL